MHSHRPVTRRQAGKSFTAIALGLAALGWSGIAGAQDTIKVGVLHSLSGTMAISETTLKDTMLLLIEEQNAKGGLLGCQIEAVVVDEILPDPLGLQSLPELRLDHLAPATHVAALGPVWNPAANPRAVRGE